MSTISRFPQAFQCYKPRHHKIYGTVCMTADNRILLVKGRQSGKWSFPKGKMEGSETSLDCALRELQEEAGLDLQGFTPLGCHKLYVGRYFFFDLERELPTSINDAREVEEVEWVPLNALAERDCNVDVNAFLDRLNRIKSP
jgi:8-oxo-dGTP pyrophosphatase MutT (NUDIX family)